MTKKEWLNELEETLRIEIPRNEVDHNISYYRHYIEDEATQKSEQEVLQTLGEPRLIAKTIIDTYQMQAGTSENYAYNEDQDYDYGDIFRQNRASEDSASDVYEDMRNQYFQIKPIKWYHKLIITLIIVLFITLLVTIGGIILKLFISFGLPILFVLFLVQAFKRR